MNHSNLINDYLAGADLVNQAIRGLNDEQLQMRPVPGMWSPLEVVFHLADSEALFAERMKRVLAEDRPPLLFSDPDGCVAALACHQRDAANEAALIALLRRQMTSILRAQPDSAWQRIGVHNTAGEQTLEQLVKKAIHHLAHHLEILRDKRQLLMPSE